MSWLEFLQNNTPQIEAGLLLLNVLLIIISALLLISNRRLHRRVSRFFGVKNARAIRRGPANANLERMLTDYLDYVKGVSSRNDQLVMEIGALNEKMSYCFRKLGVVRYNPFENMGGDFSFSAALLDETNSGFVFSCLRSREGSHTYLKRVNRLESKRRLSEEETEAIRLAAETNPRQDDDADIRQS